MFHFHMEVNKDKSMFFSVKYEIFQNTFNDSVHDHPPLSNFSNEIIENNLCLYTDFIGKKISRDSDIDK